MTEFKVPELGENVASGDVAKVLVKVGDTIKRDQPVLELETDKATIEVPSSVAGVIKEIRVKKGDKIMVGAVVLTVDDSSAGNGAGAEPPAPAVASASSSGSRAPSPEPRVPDSGSRAPDHKILSMPPRQPVEVPAALVPVLVPSVHGDRPAAPASPAVRRLAREIGVEVNDVEGSGPGGRISQDDVKDHARGLLSSVGSSAVTAGVAGRAAKPLPDFEKWGEVERVPWTSIRRATSEHLSHAWNAIPHVTQFDKADLSAMEDLRKTYRDQVTKAGGSLTVTAMLVRVLATGVKQFPQFNASLDSQHGEIVYKKYVNVGVAVDTDRGLLVPVIRDADKKNITQIAVELHQAAEKARDRKLTLEEMSGGGITISNLGGIGGTYFTPIVNWPEVAILGVSRGATEPVWRRNAFEPCLMLPLALSYDHRVIDGADAMRFMRWVVEAIEQPFLLSLIG